MSNKYLKAIGARIFSEANDLKRTISSMAHDLQVDETYLKNIIAGKCKKADTFKIINLMEKTYPIDSSDLILTQDDCTYGVVHFSKEQSKSTSRVFDRIDKEQKKTPFYEYRDTAMSKLAPFKPEWIKELRVVNDNNPYNSDVAYNNGHFMHQLTLFIGPVNFYYEIDGKKYCKEMNTGDSNYITPYIPHTFTSRDASKEAYIVAITFGGDVRRSQKEIYALGVKRVKQYKLDVKNHNHAISQLIQQYMNNENLTSSMIKTKVDINNLLNPKKKKTVKNCKKIAKILNIELSNLLVSKYNQKHEVVVCKSKKQTPSYFPNKKAPLYKIKNMARVNKLANLKAFTIKVLTQTVDKKNLFHTSLHSYIYNYGKADIIIIWKYNKQYYSKKLSTGDSIYLQPFIKHGFKNISNKKAKICISRVGGSINLCTQKELSYFNDISRVAQETQCWF